ncbi:MAG TPA: CPCC family cysteine-rich protein [Gallionellaceae bacterium]
MLELRKRYEAVSREVSLGLAGLCRKISRFSCPCCGYPTLDSRAGYDICRLCNWEDDGQDDADAAERSGCNHGYTLEAARENFSKYGTMYTPDNNPTISGGDSAGRVQLKRELVAVYGAMLAAPGGTMPRLWRRALKIEKALSREQAQRIREYEKSLERGVAR